MSAVVCGKRSSSIFEELLHSTPPPASKRARCASSPTASLRVSPSRASPSFDHCDGERIAAYLARLRSLFPEMDQQLLEHALEASGNDLDSTIKSLNDLRLESADFNLVSGVRKPENGNEMNAQLPTEVKENGVDAAGIDVLPTDGSEWVELFVREMMNASDVDDARTRVSRVLEFLEKSIMARADGEALRNLHKENMMLKEQVEVLVRENTVLKHAVAIQHHRQKEYEERSQELQHLKQLVSQYQEQVRTLEINNYALTVHLRQAQQSSSIPGRFNPDVF
ncbi:uncharacterized protein LOC135642033 isoform X2 [Musa acuminata AAA Group]|uniref:CUE domain-containing protein n=1 Tax=Musa acuminata subsp. malaccensis TaxID=214687 RepID=A0A804JSH5_MUSAM|nr:PREDICTED: uncharacterized protein LOC103990553 isoform X2 [Musa acuminata subsp. malaccensis]